MGKRLIADQLADGEIYQPVMCTACGRTHLVNSKSGEVLPHEHPTARTRVEIWAY
jgi:hypothetical protein